MLTRRFTTKALLASKKYLPGLRRLARKAELALALEHIDMSEDEARELLGEEASE